MRVCVCVRVMEKEKGEGKEEKEMRGRLHRQYSRLQEALKVHAVTVSWFDQRAIGGEDTGVNGPSYSSKRCFALSERRTE